MKTFVHFSCFLAICVSSCSRSLAQINSKLENSEPAGVRYMSQKQAQWDGLRSLGLLPHKGLASSRNEPRACTNGVVNINGETFPCDGVDFLSFISLEELTIYNSCHPNCGSQKEKTTQGSDMWGWLSPTKKEITIQCVDNGVWFIDGSVSTNPVIIGFIRSGRPQFAWCDVKVYKDTAYIVKDGGGAPTYGIEVFDLLKLEQIDPAQFPVDLSVDYVYDGHGNSHNLVIDTESGVLYSVGTGRDTECKGGLHMLDVKTNPLRPEFIGCVSEDGYTHDAQCVIYDGPDARYQQREICFAYNEDTLTIWDVTDKTSPVMLSRTGYPGATYTHQGWLTEDMKYVLLDDELDEEEGVVSTTRTFIFNVEDLRNPLQEKSFDHPDVSIDHNLYIWGAIHKKGWGGNGPMLTPPSSKYAYLSNYVAGLRILDVCDIANGNVRQAGYFDVAPDLFGNVWEGTWSNYMHPSGVIAVSSIERGLFFLRHQKVFDNSECDTTTTNPPGNDECEDQVPSGIQYSDGTKAECAELESFCSDYTFVRTNCPKTCGECGECNDKSPSGITFTDGSPAPCNEIARYCSSYDSIVEACPATCGTCATVFSKFKDFASPQFVIPAQEKETDESINVAMLGVITGFLGIACAGLAAALFVTRRALKSRNFENGIESTSTPHYVNRTNPIDMEASL